MAYEDDLALLNSSLANLNNMVQSQRDYELQNRIAEHDMELAEKQFALSEQNQVFNHMVADRNFGLQVAQHDYEKRLNQIKMQREDNAIQRRVADFQRAGFSPLAAIGSNGAGVGNIINPQAPQYDPTGINSSVDKQINALQSKQGAFARKMQNINERRNARLQSLAYSTEMSNMLTQIANNKVQRQLLQEQISTQKYKNEYYDRFGYNEETPMDRLLSKLINYAIDKYEENPVSLLPPKKPNNSTKPKQPSIKAVDSDGNQINSSTFYNTLSSLEKLFQKGDGTNINVKKLRKLANNIGWKGPEYVLPDNATKLSPQTYSALRDSLNKYLEEFNKLSPEFKNDLIDKYIKLWVGY